MKTAHRIATTFLFISVSLLLAGGCQKPDLEPAARARVSTLGEPETDRDHATKAALEALLALEGLEQLGAEDEPEHRVLTERLGSLTESLQVPVPDSADEVRAAVGASPAFDDRGMVSQSESITLHGIIGATHIAAENAWTWYRQHR